MSFDHVLGQPTATATLSRALSSGQVHHAYRFEGPDGVGKMLCARAFAKALVCETQGGLGCGQCRSCELATSISEEAPQVPRHPDVIMVERGLYPPALLGRSTPETTGISVQQIRKIVLPRAGYPPHEGRALCIIVNRADELTIASANALLKTLEEPLPKTHFVLLTSRPGKLLDTVRSRTLSIRFAPLSDTLVEKIGGPFGVTPEIARLAQGSMSTAIELADPESHAARQAFADAALSALTAPDFATALTFPNHRSENRDELGRQLAHLANVFASQAAENLAARPEQAGKLAQYHQLVLQTLKGVDHNAQPGLLLESMIAKLRAL